MGEEFFYNFCYVVPDGFVTFHRKILTEQIDWKNSTKPICKVTTFPSGTIEDSPTNFYADFASDFLGGNVFKRGGTQEETLFSIKPELLISMILVPRINDNEALVVVGAEQFSSYSGFGIAMNFQGNFVDKHERFEQFNLFGKLHFRDLKGRKKSFVAAVDAIQSWGLNQFLSEYNFREISKVFLAFSKEGEEDDMKPVATGNWGCGSYGMNNNSVYVLRIYWGNF